MYEVLSLQAGFLVNPFCTLLPLASFFFCFVECISKFVFFCYVECGGSKGVLFLIGFG